MATITILSDSITIPTGYSDQSTQLADYLSNKGHKIHFLGNAYQGESINNFTTADNKTHNLTMHGMGKQPYFADIMSDHLKTTNTDAFVILLDTFMLYPWFLNVDTSPAQTFFWYPSDGGGGMPIGCDQILKKVERPVAMAQFGQKQVKDYYNLDVNHIPHGTDKNLFKKLPETERNKLKEKYGLQGKFVIGVVARNQPRKNLDRTLKAFQILSIVKEKIPNAVLFFHSDPNDNAAYFNMMRLISRYNIENRVVFSNMNALKGIPRSQMNEIYNVMDVKLLTTSGEGFGVPIIEAMSAEVPVLATDYTTTAELIIQNQSGLGIKLVGTEKISVIGEGGAMTMDSKEYDDMVSNGTLTGSWEVERGMCDIIDCAEKLVYLYNNPEARKQMGLKGRKAVEDKYDFETIVGPAWEKLILESIK